MFHRDVQLHQCLAVGAFGTDELDTQADFTLSTEASAAHPAVQLLEGRLVPHQSSCMLDSYDRQSSSMLSQMLPDMRSAQAGTKNME